MNIAVIPARGGSKRIPRKNIRMFAGRPMIAHSICCARNSGAFDRVVVSTDDPEIAAIARQFGAETPFVRPAALSDDFATTMEVMAHAVGALQSEGAPISAVCCIYATAPFLLQEDIKRGLSILQSGSWQFVFAATTYAHPILRAFHCDARGGLQMFFPGFYATRSQDMKEAMHDAGQFYWGTMQAWLNKAKVFDADSTIVQIPRWRVQDIDTEEDWTRAEFMAASLLARQP
jgi:pseudaminic acid cytidylyltransferase